jgi:hypothetical protein
MPIVWFSTNQDWELTANKSWKNQDGILIFLDKTKTRELGGPGAIRCRTRDGTARLARTERVERHVWPDGARALPRSHCTWRKARPVVGHLRACSALTMDTIEVYRDGTWVPVPLDSGPGLITNCHNQQV